MPAILVPILAFFSWFAKNILFKLFKVGAILVVLIAVLTFIGAFFVKILSLLVSLLDLLNESIEYFNAYFSTSSDSLISVFWKLISDFGIICALENSFNLFKPIFLVIIVLYATKILYKFGLIFVKFIHYLFTASI